VRGRIEDAQEEAQWNMGRGVDRVKSTTIGVRKNVGAAENRVKKVRTEYP